MPHDRRTAPLAGFADAFAAAASDAVRTARAPVPGAGRRPRSRRPQRRAGSRRPVGGRGRARLPAAGRAEHRRRRRRHRRALARSLRSAGGLGARQRGGARGRAGRGARRARARSSTCGQPHQRGRRTARPRNAGQGCALDLHPRASGMGAARRRCSAAPRSSSSSSPTSRSPTGCCAQLVRGLRGDLLLLAAREEFSSARASVDRRQRPLRALELVERVEVEAADAGAGSATRGASPRISASGLNWRVISRRSQPRWWREEAGRLRRARSSSRSAEPRVVDDARAARSRSAGRCRARGPRGPRRRSRSASKQIWLMMHVAIGALANIAWIVSSSEIRWWLSG